MNYQITSSKKTQKNCFYMLNKGMNSGKPLNSPCPNCFAVIASNEADLQTLYWLSFALWKGKKFELLLGGSVIPFIRIKDVRNLISENLQHAISNPEGLQKTVKFLQAVELREQQLNENIKLIKELKHSYAHSFFNKKMNL